MDSPLTKLKQEYNELSRVVAGLRIKMTEDTKRLEKYEKSIKLYGDSIKQLEKGDEEERKEAKAYKC